MINFDESTQLVIKFAFINSNHYNKYWGVIKL